MELIGPARFDDSGTFHRNPLVQSIPKEVSGLPKKERLITDLKRLSGESTPSTILLIDLDNFKRVNDTKGHAQGEKCLGAVTKAISVVIEGKGNLYRYGRDEFVVVLPNFSIAEGSATAERIRARIETSKAGGEINVTASIGVAAFDGNNARIGNHSYKAPTRLCMRPSSRVRTG